MAADSKTPGAPPDDPAAQTHPQDEKAYQATRTWNPPSRDGAKEAVEGRDVPPGGDLRPDRDPEDPWMGGG